MCIIAVADTFGPAQEQSPPLLRNQSLCWIAEAMCARCSLYYACGHRARRAVLLVHIPVPFPSTANRCLKTAAISLQIGYNKRPPRLFLCALIGRTAEQRSLLLLLLFPLLLLLLLLFAIVVVVVVIVGRGVRGVCRGIWKSLKLFCVTEGVCGGGGSMGSGAAEEVAGNLLRYGAQHAQHRVPEAREVAAVGPGVADLEHEVCDPPAVGAL